MTCFLILTALTVSIDSFVCGFSLAFLNKKKLPVVLIIASTVLIMCLLTNYAPIFFNNFLDENASFVGGFILLVIGVLNLIKCIKNFNHKNDKYIFCYFHISLLKSLVMIDTESCSSYD